MIAALRRLPALLVIIAACATPAMAQDESTLALVASFPSPTVGLQWELSDRFALRFEGSYTFRNDSAEVASTGDSLTDESTTHSGSIGVSGLITLHRAEQLRLYVAPRILLGFTRQRISSSLTSVPLGTYFIGVPSDISVDVTGGIIGGVTGGLSTTLRSPQTVKYSSTAPAAGAAFGAAASVHRRLSLFGEAGFMYRRDNLPPVGALIVGIRAIEDLDARRTTIYTRAIAGLLIHF